MTVPAASRRPAPFSAPRRLVARHPVASFLVMVYTLNTAVALSPLLTRRDILPFDLAPYDSLGHIFGVALPAFLVVAATHGKAGVWDLARRSLRWRLGVRWYLIALFGVPIGVVLCASVIFGLEPLNALVEKWPLLFTVVLPQLLLLILFYNVAEEVGWTGFLQASLQERHGPLKASVIVTLPFALFHLPSWMVEFELGLSELHIALLLTGFFGVSQLFGRVVIMWLYNNTGYSVLVVGMFHSSFNVTTSAFGPFIPRESSFLIAASVVAVFAVLVVVFTRGRLCRTNRSMGRNHQTQLREEVRPCPTRDVPQATRNHNTRGRSLCLIGYGSGWGPRAASPRSHCRSLPDWAEREVRTGLAT